VLVQVIRPETLSPAELDERLGRGWFRIGDTLMTCEVVWFEGVLRSALWTRLPVQQHVFKKSHRKLMRRIERDLEVAIEPMVIDDERRAIYERYRDHVGGERAAALDEILGPDRGRGLFDTWELSFRRGGRLVAFSWFDLGEDSVQSLAGVFEPEHGRDSLGFASMLFEVRYAQELGLSHFYPGYLLPGAPEMEYKRRVGPLEIWDPHSQDWRPPSEELEVMRVAERMRGALSAVAARLWGQGSMSALQGYRSFDLPYFRTELADGIRVPLVLRLRGRGRRDQGLLLTWHPRRRFRLQRCQSLVLVARNAEGEVIEGTRRSFERIVRVLGSAETVDEAVELVVRSLG
jgi:arginyl-tRNA--protein-N-Asp/Glu arginylyltransferase